MLNPYIVITGTGSSGTKFITKVFKRAGLDIGHEKKGKHGSSSWHIATGSVSAKLPFRWNVKFDQLPGEKVILHQVRNPLKTISTIQRYSSHTWTYISNFVDLYETTSYIHACMKYWYEWQIMALRISDFTYMVENIDNEWENICDIIKRPELIKLKKECLNGSREENTKKEYYTPLTWGTLKKEDEELAGKIINLGKQFGYQL